MSVTFYSRLPGADGPREYDFDGPNFSNGNAYAILTWLGYDVADALDLCGELEPDDLAGRCLTAQAVGGVGYSDEGSPDVSVPMGRGRMVDCGRRPGYFDDAAKELRALAERAKAAGHEVVYA